jgi:uncharacterized protein with HEPN domain
MPLEDSTRIRHMIEAAPEALSYCADMDEDAFRNDRRTQRAVVQCIQVIGEAANRVADVTQSQSTGVPWDQIVGMRHRIVHTYFDIDLALVWQVIKKDLQPLIDELRKWEREQS